MGRQAVFRFVQQIEGVLVDGSGKEFQGAFPVGALGHIVHQAALNIAGGAFALGIHHFGKSFVVCQGAQLHGCMPRLCIFFKQCCALLVNALVEFPDTDEMVKHIVAGQNAAAGGQRIGFPGAQRNIIAKKIRAVVYRAPLHLQRFGDYVQQRGFSAAVSAAENGDGGKSKGPRLPAAEHAEGIIGRIAGAAGLGIGKVPEIFFLGLAGQGE